MMTADTETLPIQVPVTVTHLNDKPCIMLRRWLTEKDLIKEIVQKAYNNEPVVIVPHFTNRINSLNMLVEKGIIYRNQEDGQWYFTF